jgi:phosphoribosylglycinamide formyltransferase-1
MRLIGDVLLQAFNNRIINIHPALLPAFPGKNGILQAYQYGVKIFGVTVHYVDAGMDTGKILAQECFKANGTETLEEIEQKIHAIEHQIYTQVIREVL